MITEPQPQRCPSCGQQDCRADLCDKSAAHKIVVINNRWHKRFKSEIDRYRDSLNNDRIAELNTAKVIDSYNTDDPEYLEKCVQAMREAMLEEFKHGVARGMLNGQ